MWFALGSLAVLQQNEVERFAYKYNIMHYLLLKFEIFQLIELFNLFCAFRLSTLGLDNTIGSNIDLREVTKQYCMNHDDGMTHAMIDCSVCGPNCQECDRILHLHSKNRSHKRQV